MIAPHRRLAWILLPPAFGAFQVCCTGPVTPGQRARDSAHEYAMAVRFGRMDLASERVSTADRGRFSSQHANWGNGIRILDCELVGIVLRDRGHADALLSVGWQRIDDADVRTTQIAQHWADHRGAWLLESEERAAGDPGLLGEKVVVQPAAARPTQFESVRIP